MRYIDSEKLIAEIERRIEETKSMKPTFDQFWAGQISAFKGCLNIIYSLKQEQPEWSEEDNNALNYIHELISFGFTENFMDAQTAADMREWLNNHLKSICPRPHWKPSEEQIQALTVAIDEAARCEDPWWRDSLHDVLLSLHTDLKKLFIL